MVDTHQHSPGCDDPNRTIGASRRKSSEGSWHTTGLYGKHPFNQFEFLGDRFRDANPWLRHVNDLSIPNRFRQNIASGSGIVDLLGQRAFEQDPYRRY